MTEPSAGVLVRAAGRLHDAIEADELTDDDSHCVLLRSLRCSIFADEPAGLNSSRAIALLGLVLDACRRGLLLLADPRRRR